MTPSRWGSVIIDGTKIVGGVGDAVPASADRSWSTTGTIDVAPGRYRLRTAIVAADGRIGTLDLPLTVGLRAPNGVICRTPVVSVSAPAPRDPAVDDPASRW